MSQILVGVDCGGTKTEVCVIEVPGPNGKGSPDLAQYKLLARQRMKTEKQDGLNSFLNRLRDLMLATVEDAGVKLSSAKSIGLGLPGSIDPETLVLGQGSVQFFKGVDLRTAFSKALGFSGPLYFDNDANCFALAEAHLGAGVNWAKQNNLPLSRLCLVGVILGTGVGGGLIANGKLIRGRRGGAGEIGHITLIESGRPCYCGNFGCVEQYLSGPAFEHSYASRASNLSRLSAKEIFKNADSNDPLAIATIEHYRDHLVTFLSTVSNFFDPHVIVLGGGMSVQPRLYPGIQDRLSKRCFLQENPPAVLHHACGDSAGVLGAALLGHWKDA